ncbi:unnamed protein product [Euphydryas editha]|uniref:Regulatory protein zeste n=1 Tax=Euphydryas editha TaxID=104508 RepID=A0AAU9UDA9_EUPED|nr:unnamed protein product [Euphydryas editha]CAH2100826.1 unnamed protein product [Euphydryas editha]
MEDNKTSRKRVANFTADEKALLAQLVKNRPIIESKLTDGKSVVKKKSAWLSLTEEFNSNAHVHKRDTITLKRAWDNLKAMARKTRATERGHLIKTGGGPSNPPHTSQQGAIISMVEEAAPVMICEVKNSFDSDGSVLLSIGNETEKINVLDDNIFSNCSIDVSENTGGSQTMLTEAALGSEQNTGGAHDILCASSTPKSMFIERAEQRKPSDFVRREGVLRIKHFEAKKKIEIQILKAKLENEVIKKQAAEMEEERNRTLLEIAKLELAELKKRCEIK